jgi:apolipoprotein N-acyltransferase
MGDAGIDRFAIVAGWICLAAYCALYMAAFVMLVSGWFDICGTDDWRKNLAFTVVAPLLWVGLEYVRSHLISGFPWNTLGVSQHDNLAVCQLARWGGVYAVSALVVMVNAGLAMTGLTFRGVRIGKRYRTHPELMLTLLVFMLCLISGAKSVLKQEENPPSTEYLVAAIQPNIKQVMKWSTTREDMIYETLHDLTEGAAPGSDLVIWPETATPHDALNPLGARPFVTRLLSNDVPILVGSMYLTVGEDGTNYYNSSVLFEPSGTEPVIYSKQHLLPFGEYVPFASIIPALAKMAPPGWSCTAGESNVVFSTQSRPDVKFSCLICFEDTIPGLSRKAVKQGARLLINQTNDAWFDVSSGARQHMAHCIFRCIENGVPAVRITNTGITCAIDRLGRVQDLETQSLPPPLVQGYGYALLSIPEDDMELTFYTRYGDVVSLPSAVGAVICFVLVAVRERRLKSAPSRSRKKKEKK